MADTRIPHGFLTHPQALIAGEDATNLHLRALVWSGEHRTDGAIPAVALGVLTSRSDAGELALRLVAAGLWSVTATGWQMVRERLSVIRAEAGRRGGLRSGEVRAAKPTKQVPKPAASGSPGVADTTYGRASGTSGTPERVSEGEEKNSTTTTTPSVAREGERVAVAVPASPSIPPQREIDGAMAILSKHSQGRFNRYAGTAADRQELAVRLVGYGVNRPILERMGVLMLNPKAVWPWAKTLKPGGYVSPSWMLGRRDANGERAAVAVEQLVGAARDSLAEDARREREARERTEAREAERVRRANAPPPMTAAERAAAVAAFRAGLPVQTTERAA